MYSNNRDYHTFIKNIEKVLSKDDSIFSLILIDLDYFHKESKDKKDVYIEKTFNILNKYLPGILYLGKDEFGAVLENTRMEETLKLLEHSKDNLIKLFDAKFCAGIVEVPKHGKDIPDLLRYLEEAIYNAKIDGRNRVYFANTEKMKLKSNYYTQVQLKRLAELSIKLNRSEASLLRESLDVLFREYEN